MLLSHGIANYIKSLNLPTDGTHIFVSIVNEPNHQPPEKRRIPLTIGKSTRLPKGSDWDNTHFHLKRG